MDLAAFERLVQKHFPGRRLLNVRPLAGGISAQTFVIEFTPAQPFDGAKIPDGPPEAVEGAFSTGNELDSGTASHAPLRVVVRQHGQAVFSRLPAAAELEFALLRTLIGTGVRAPTPIALDTARDSLPSPYLIMEYIEGQPDFSTPQPPEFAEQMAHMLARIHAVPGSYLGLTELPRLVEQPAPRRLDAPAPALDTGPFVEIVQAAWPFSLHNPPALLHGDYWPGNVLWQDSRLTGVIDWEDASTGDPLADIAITRLDLFWIYGRDTMDYFTQHYLSETTHDASRLPFWDLWAALRLSRLVAADLEGWAAFFLPYGRTDITPALISACYKEFVGQALNALPRTFR